MKRVLALSAMVAAGLYLPVSGTIINVPGDYLTIQSGIDATEQGDTVLVADGRYYERISFCGKAILVTSEFMLDGDTLHIQNTIIDADTLQIGVADTGSVVLFVNGEDLTSVIQGFTIQNGIGTSISIYHRLGGGIYCNNNSSPRIADNIIIGNSSSSGAGICCVENSDAIISDNFISGNRDQGIYVSDSHPLIADNVITLNISEYGSGICCNSGSDAVIRGNIIFENYGGLWGGGILCCGSNPLIEYNMIYANSVYDWGGGICCDDANPSIISNTISGNSALANGGGVFCLNGASPTLINTIVWANSPEEVGLRSGGNPEITYCDIRGGWEGSGNVDLDPLFTAAYLGDFNVCSQSPCINGGDPDRTDPDGSRSDIGAYFPDHPECDIGKMLHVSVSGDDLNGDGTAENPFRTIQHGIDVALAGDTVLVVNGEYEENIKIAAKSLCLASSYIFSGDREDIENTIIDGDFDTTTVTFAGCDSGASISGFSITSGRGWFGGGIFSDYSDPIISDNIISGNISDAVGGGIYCQFGSPVIVNNEIIGNTADHGGGGIECYYSTAVRISRNLISGNSASRGGGIYATNVGSGSFLANNVFSGNTASWYGGGIAFFGLSCPVVNNTLCDNFASNGGGLYCNHSDVTVVNTIFWADTASSEDPEVYLDENSSATITYSDIRDGWEGEGNIDINPIFRDPEDGDFHLMSTDCGDPEDSPCIDAGHPDILDSLLDCSWGLGGLRSDMGAYGGGDSVQVGIDDDQIRVPGKLAMYQNYPNPFNATTTIRYSLPSASDVTIDIYDLLGRKVDTIVQDEQPAGFHQITWDASDHSSGPYFYRIQAGDYVQTRKMVLLK
jgi:parallel beta-helix repeat protein